MAGPLVLVFDDIHWGEETFLDLLGYVLEWTDGVPVCVLCLARKELLDRRPGWATGQSSTVVVLESLGRSECDALLRGLLGTLDVPVEVTTAIDATAEGNPLFVEELIAMLIDEGLLVRDDGHWTPSPDLAHVAVPPTSRHFSPRDWNSSTAPSAASSKAPRSSARCSSGAQSRSSSPAELRPDLGGSLMSLVRKEVIRPAPSDLSEEDAFRFRHLLIRDAAYEGIAKETRAELHEQFAGWLESRAPERLSETQAIVGYHLERSFRYREELGASPDAWLDLAREAARHLGEAGRRSLGRADMPAAANLLGRAVAILPTHDALKPQLTIDLVDALRELGGFERVEKLAEEGRALAQEMGDRGLELRFELRQLAFHTHGRPGERDLPRCHR